MLWRVEGVRQDLLQVFVDAQRRSELRGRTKAAGEGALEESSAALFAQNRCETMREALINRRRKRKEKNGGYGTSESPYTRL